ncbi:MAG: hypothetical protein HYV37_01875 [Candidatus Levyibacteriota bacterium]|nr:MAG: hypothetical protein HYV37_01875 [Candidatus Levybacteria bacterium]
MPTLHAVTEETKQITKWAVITVFALILLFFVVRFGTTIKEYFYPTPPAPPTVAFGKLPSLIFPNNSTDKKLLYSLDTITGTLPNFPDRTTVYSIDESQPNLLGLQNAQKKVEAIGFNNSPYPLSENTYIWTETASPFRKLILNIVSNNFTLSSNYLLNPDLLIKTPVPDQASAQTSATNFLTRLSLFPNDIDIAKTKTTLLTIQNQRLVEASSPSTAQVVRVDFYQKDINQIPIYYPNPPQSIIYFILTGGRFDEEIIEAKFNHSTINQTSSATYPIKTADQAFAELQKQKAYLASYFGNQDIIRIKNVSLGYYLGDPPQTYLMPIIVFEGDNGFFAYVPAITDAWIDTASVRK